VKSSTFSGFLGDQENATMAEPRGTPTPIATGQRVAGETRFETSQNQVGRIRFTHPAQGPLPIDEHAFPSSDTSLPEAASKVIYTAELAPSPSVWEARSEDDDQG
jgi:hypothetical protein